MFAGILIVVIFLIFAALMMTRKLPALLALPAMAVVVGLVAGVFYDWSNSESTLGQFIFDTVLTQGSVKLAQAMMFAAFGSILSQVVMRSGIATRLISLTAEYAGRHKFWLALILTLMTAVCFSSVTGLGAVIMIGSLVLPIMMGVGLSASFSAGLMLLAIALGGIFNPVNLGFYVDVLKLPQDTVQSYVLVYGILLSVTTLVFLGVGMWRERGSFNWAESAELPKSRASLPSLITPVLPVLLIFVFNMQDIAPVLGLFIGIGMCLAAMTAEPTRLVMEPLLQAIIPQTPWAFVLIFFVLAPMALYRGPLNMYGLGAGVASILLGSSILPPTAILAAFFSVGQVQGVCDPTNTHNVWLAQFTKVNADKLLKTTLPYVWAFVGVALAWAAFVADALG